MISELARLPTSAMTEQMLERGGLGRLGARTLVEACACGGVIVAEDHAASIADAVHLHNESTDHAQAMRAMGWRHDGQRR